ncbi:CcdB family protein [Pseudorhodoferax sp.]|uniref:CcdB family protein n=1 Tax=Pseudorhodoferax sp. TaxID=1993553 RepID=UPI002DD631BF|nr:CcdB family protein [Pseudorhodoferax sp.]
MAQFDVYANPQASSRQSVPYVVDVQSPLIDVLHTRLVMPLSRVGVGQARLPASLCPTVEVDGEPLSLMPHLAAPLVARLLGEPVASVSHLASDVVGALDAVVSGF